jgi:hypothetical protein
MLPAILYSLDFYNYSMQGQGDIQYLCRAAFSNRKEYYQTFKVTRYTDKRIPTFTQENIK